MAMAPDMQLAAKVEGGMMKGLKRSVLGGESLFISTATAGPQGGWIDFAPSLPGDLTTFDVTPDAPLLVQKVRSSVPRVPSRSTRNSVASRRAEFRHPC